MATSGTSSFNVTRNDIIRRAARLCGAIRQGQSLGGAAIADFEHALNSMVKRWQGSGIHVWTTTEGVLVPVAYQTVYSAGLGATDHVAYAEDFYISEIDADEAAGQTVLTLVDGSNIAVNDYVGVVVDDGTVWWSTATLVAGNDVTIADALPDGAAAGSKVFSYTSRIVRPLKVVAARRYSLDSSSETPIRMEARLDYQDMPNKASNGMISSMFYDPSLTAGKFSIWQTPAYVRDIIKFTWHRPIQDFNSGGDNPDLPQEWIDALSFNLALSMAVEYGLGERRYAMVKEQAIAYLDAVKDFDREAEPIRFGVNFDQW